MAAASAERYDQPFPPGKRPNRLAAQPNHVAHKPPGLTVELEILVDVETPEGLDIDRLGELIRFALLAEKATGPWAVSVLLTGDERIRQLHRDFMSVDTATDVMTFPFSDEECDLDEPAGGDIVISVERAGDQAAEFGLTLTDEIRFLVLHGVLHLSGWDDATAADRAEMLEWQTTLLRAFDTGGRNFGR